MKKPDEIKKGLGWCVNDAIACSEQCPYFNSMSNGVDCAFKLHTDALAYIQQLERERDAAIKDIPRRCKYCVRESPQYLKDGKMDDVCWTCFSNNHINWEWAGTKEDNQ